MGRSLASWAYAHGSLDPAQYASLALTHVQYHPEDPLSMPLAFVSLSPPFLIVAYLSVLMVRRELTIFVGFVGQLACEALNLMLKRTFKQGRPTTFLGTGYGMPSSHSQFAGYFAAFWTLHLLRNRPGMTRARKTGRHALSLIDFLRSLEHFALFTLINLGSILTAYSRYHLSYHTPLQIAIGVGLGVGCGVAWYVMCEVYMRKPLLGFKRSFRQTALENPVCVAFRIRDSWAIWDDAGIEAEYGLWRREYTRSLQPLKKTDGPSKPHQDVEHMQLALRLASQCDETTTAFCVGCVVVEEETQSVIATGYSRELPGNTHAEEVALDKISRNEDASSDDRKGVSGIIPLTLYTTMEPCSERLSKKDACVQRILQFNASRFVDQNNGKTWKIRRIVQGVREPEDFVQCAGTRLLREEGLTVVQLSPGSVFKKSAQPELLRLEADWLEREAVRLAKHGHPDQPTVRGEEDRVWKEAGWVPYEEAGVSVINSSFGTPAVGNGLRPRGK